MRRELGAVEAPHAPAERAPLNPNDRVRIRSLHTEGSVVEDYGETVLIAIGPMKTVVQRSDVEKRAGGASKDETRSSGARARLDAAARSTSRTRRSRQAVLEAEPLVERWIDEAALAGNSTLRLIHGKGTGMLGRGLQEYLRTHPSVKSLRYGSEDEGSGGVTMFELG